MLLLPAVAARSPSLRAHPPRRSAHEEPHGYAPVLVVVLLSAGPPNGTASVCVAEFCPCFLLLGRLVQHCDPHWKCGPCLYFHMLLDPTVEGPLFGSFSCLTGAHSGVVVVPKGGAAIPRSS
ncbi:uncharacterized protein [Lolium perenne]|uniref:uncharacterized protein n=1 Tax=Lolium perenne TaxID=4522 RepID=UPI003A98EDB8